MYTLYCFECEHALEFYEFIYTENVHPSTLLFICKCRTERLSISVCHCAMWKTRQIKTASSDEGPSQTASHVEIAIARTALSGVLRRDAWFPFSTSVNWEFTDRGGGGERSVGCQRRGVRRGACHWKDFIKLIMLSQIKKKKVFSLT